MLIKGVVFYKQPFFLPYHFFINKNVYILAVNIKIRIMEKTQLDEVRAEVRLLELQLQHAALFQDAFSQMDLYKKLQEKKSLLDTLQWM